MTGFWINFEQVQNPFLIPLQFQYLFNIHLYLLKTTPFFLKLPSYSKLLKKLLKFIKILLKRNKVMRILSISRTGLTKYHTKLFKKLSISKQHFWYKNLYKKNRKFHFFRKRKKYKFKFNIKYLLCLTNNQFKLKKKLNFNSETKEKNSKIFLFLCFLLKIWFKLFRPKRIPYFSLKTEKQENQRLLLRKLQIKEYFKKKKKI